MSIFSAGVALFPFEYDAGYANTTARRIYLWLEFAAPIALQNILHGVLSPLKKIGIRSEQFSEDHILDHHEVPFLGEHTEPFYYIATSFR